MEAKRNKLTRAMQEVPELPEFNPAWITAEPRHRVSASLFSEKTTLQRIMPGLLAAATVLFGVSAFLYIQKSGPEQTVAARALVLTVSGTAQVERGGKTTQVFNGDVLTEKDRLSVGADGRVDLALAGHSVRILAGTDVVISQLNRSKEGTAKNVELGLDRGNILSSVSRLERGDSFVVRTPTAIAGVRGTRFGIAVNENSTTVQLIDGSVAVTPNGKKEQILEPGSAVEVTAQEVRSIPVTTGTSDAFKDMEASKMTDPGILAAADSVKAAHSEEELVKLYQRIEIIRLKDGRVFRGVTIQTNGRVMIHTADGLHILEAAEVADVSFPTEQ
ncbi:MAG: FecR domain-containing protein [Spirochaetia bacterium]|nr:FecR domain-containing protein [Spirochaetia bacterium]